MDLRQSYARAEGVRQQSGSNEKIVRLDFRQTKYCALRGALQQNESIQIVFM
jgi:hypothetical protein